MGAIKLYHVTHYAIGSSFDSPCGMTSMWHRGLAFVRDARQVSCKRCRRWLRQYGDEQGRIAP